MAEQVTPNLKVMVECAKDGCGLADCTAYGVATKNGHVRGCTTKCPQCRGRRNKRKGQRKQSSAVRAIGIQRSSLSPGHEEFLPGALRTEVKSGGIAKPVWTKFLASEAQSNAARAVGDHRPFVALFMPDGTKDGLIVFRLSAIAETVQALYEQLLEDAS